MTTVEVSAAPHPVDPVRWPAVPAADPALSGTAHSIRYFGPDRYQTNLATVLGLRGQGSFPFDTPDRTSGGAATLADAGNWWGARSCPRGVIVVAGDVFTDALAATSLSNPTGLGPGPLLERVAAADPLFDPPGAFVKVDLTRAPIIVTPSGRQGARGLGLSARLAAQDMAAGGCTTARNAVIVGGESAVPKAVESDLLSLGYTQIFRVSGTDRFDTAARAALALGTQPVPAGITSCESPGSFFGPVHMGWYAPGVVELRDGVEECRLLGRSVVLADAGTGADALAAGWWASYWQVPLLYTDANGTLPTATTQALASLGAQNVLVLGGTGRIPEPTLVAALAATGTAAQATRVAGTDRYGTSVEMAKVFGGWWPTGRASSFEQSMVCLAASSGNGNGSTGWPDALAAGPWCAAANGSVGNPLPPLRALPPADGLEPRTSGGGPARPARDAVPVLLVPSGSTTLPVAVNELLTDAFVPGSPWCTSVVTSGSCVLPGFAVTFGGTTSVTQSAELAAARAVSGVTYATADDLSPSIGTGFQTALDMSPVFTGGQSAGRKMCFRRGGVSDVRWLSVFGEDGAANGASDVMTLGLYTVDADGLRRSPAVSAPSCVATGGSTGGVQVEGTSLSGRSTDPRLGSNDPTRILELAGSLVHTVPRMQGGSPAGSVAQGATSTWTYVDAFSGVAILVGGLPTTVTDATISVTLRRGSSTTSLVRTDLVSGAFSLSTASGLVTGAFEGEAVLIAGVWRLRATTTLDGSLLGGRTGLGGFRADLTPNGASSADDALTWAIDGLLES